MKKLGFGLMRLPLLDPTDQSSVDVDLIKKMVDLFIERGFTYFDTAFPYHEGESERTFGELVAKRYPRKKFTIADKMPCWEVSDHGTLQSIFNLQLQNCAVDYFDYYLLHSLDSQSYAEMKRVEAFSFFNRMKEEGKIKRAGFSFHDRAEVLEHILSEQPQVEFVQLQINYLDWQNPQVQSKECYEVCVKHHKPVIVMEPVKGGTLADVAELKELDEERSPASWAIRFAASLENVFMVLSGMNTLEQILDNTSFMQNFIPLDASEKEMLYQLGRKIQSRFSIPCTNCHYCTAKCPQNIAIPEYFRLCNTIYNLSSYQELLLQGYGMASECISCGQCEERCPQHLPIRQYLQKVVEIFER